MSGGLDAERAMRATIRKEEEDLREYHRKVGGKVTYILCIGGK